MKHLIFITSLILSISLIPLKSFAEQDPHVVKPPVEDLTGAHSCGAKGCHTRINREWADTIHAHSTPNKDPLVGAFFKYLEGHDYDTKQCLRCHEPLRAIYGTDEPNEVFDEGVTCVFCHSITGLSKEPGAKGKDFYTIDLTSPGTSPYKPSGESAHDSKYLGLFRTINMCGGCHQEGETDFIASKGRTIMCQSCHMPSKQNKRAADSSSKAKDKVYRHLFEGGHSETLLSMAVVISNGIIEVNGDTTSFTFDIESDAYHDIPIGFPFRSIYAQVLAMDENDEILWQNYTEHPYDDKQAYFGRIFKPEDDVFAHPARDVEPVWKQVIPPKSSVSLAYDIKSTEVAYFEVRVFYRLLVDSIIEKLNLDPSEAPETLMAEEFFYPDE